MGVKVRAEQTEDYEAIEAVTNQAFSVVEYSAQNEHIIINKLRDAGELRVSLVAEQDNTIIGHVAVSAININSVLEGWYGIGPISVLPEYQGLGVGSKLMNSAIENLKQLKAQGTVTYHQAFNG